jgi:universal stress protein A
MINLHHILVATDFSDYSKEAIDYAVHLAKCFGADLHLLHVFEPPLLVASGVSTRSRPQTRLWIRNLRQELANNLDKLAQEIRAQGAKVDPIMREGTPYIEIPKAVEQVAADLIVLGTHGRTGIVHVLMGSVAEHVVRKSPCPVLTVRPKTLGEAKKAKGSSR